MVVFEQSAETVVAENRLVAWDGVGRVLREEDHVVFALMRALFMVMFDILGNGVFEGKPRRRRSCVEAFIFNGPDESLSVGIEVRASGRNFQRFDAGGAEDHAKAFAELGITVMDQVTAFADNIAPGHDEVTGELAHPGIGGIGVMPAR